MPHEYPLNLSVILASDILRYLYHLKIPRLIFENSIQTQVH